MIHYLFARALTEALELLLIRTKSFRLVPDDTENGSVLVRDCDCKHKRSQELKT